MQDHVRTRIVAATHAERVVGREVIQPLWNNYGTLSRVFLRGGSHASVIIKHIRIPDRDAHPRGFVGSLSRARKIRSYEVETHWYQNQNSQVPQSSATPTCLDAFADSGELFILLEDLANRGFTDVVYHVQWLHIEVVLGWLARFHSRFLGDPGQGLWECGTYWHLETRPDEWANIAGSSLHRWASFLDARLRCGDFPTLVHGDAKLANFLFSADRTAAAAVDFQYVGRGAAVKDVAYFVGSCLSGPECERREPEVLAAYFKELRRVLPEGIDGDALEAEWRELYPVAWADFERFMAGWSPGHRKRTDYSDATTDRALNAVIAELREAARRACLEAGRFVHANRNRSVDVGSKGLASRASDVVTEIDLEAQALIMDILAPSIARYDLGVLAEEGDHDQSRLKKHAFWTVDPLDGTQYFIEGRPGYATSVALVSRSGDAILGAVYDPVNNTLFEVLKGQGVTVNGKAFAPAPSKLVRPTPVTWYADRSLRDHPCFPLLEERFTIRFIGGAVANVLKLLSEPQSVYLKAPKTQRGGCAIWDLAAVGLMLTERSGAARFYGGEPLHLNRESGVYFNDVGLAFVSPDLDLEGVLERVQELGFTSP